MDICFAVRTYNGAEEDNDMVKHITIEYCVA